MTSLQNSPHRLVVVTGATGFLGSHISDLLLAREYSVRASVRATSDLRWLSGKPVETMTAALAEADESDDSALAALLDGAEAVIHCAGITSARSEADYMRGNVQATAELLRAAARQPTCRVFVLISSLAAAGPAPATRPRDEQTPPEPITAYGRSKLAAENLLEDSRLDLRSDLRRVILRPPALYGPRDRAFLPLFRLARAGWAPRLGHRTAALSLVDGRDAAAAAVTLLESAAARGPYFVDDGHVYRWQDITAALSQAFRRRVRSVPIPLRGLRWASRLIGPRAAARSLVLNPDRLADFAVPGWVCEGEKLRRDTGFQATFNLQRGFQDTLDFYLREGWLDAT